MTRTCSMMIAVALSLGGCGDDESAPEAQVIAEFDGAAFELPESLAYHDGLAYLSFLNGWIVTVDPSGMVSTFGDVAIDPPGSAYALGIAVDPGGAVFVAVAKASATSAFPSGVYRIPAAGGTAELFASHPELFIPNDVDLDADGNVYITADGRIFKASGAGEAELWKEDALLASSDGATGPCGARTSPFPIGANGIEVESDRVVVGNTESASLVEIAIEENGSAGAATTLVMEPSQLCGVDGLVGDEDGSFLATALGTTLVRIASEGSIATVHAGEPLLSPAGVDVGTFGGHRRALVANPDFEAAFGADGPPSAEPNLTAVPL